MSFDIAQQAGFEFSPETLLLEIERRLQEQRNLLENVLPQLQTTSNEARVLSKIGNIEFKIENLLSQKQLFQEQVVIREPFIDEPQITPKNNTFRNALIIGGALLFVL